MIKINNISAGYNKEKIIDNISFEIKEGELVGVLGANGSGKSTFAKAICNILPHSGNVLINDQIIEDLNIRNIANYISYIPQHSGLTIDISVFDVVMMGFNSKLKLFEKPHNDMENKALNIIKLIGLGDKINSNYMMLSEGQKQMTILARALVSDAKFLVMDEPESALDFNVRYKMINIIKKWVCKDNRASLIILHDVMLALNNCDKLFLLKDKNIISVVDLHNESVNSIEEKLKMIYGDISLNKLKNKMGNDKYVIVFDSEDI